MYMRERKHIFRGIMLCLLSAMLIVTSMPVTASAFETKSEPFYDDTDFVRDAMAKNPKQQAIIEYIYADYMSGNDRYKGKGECYGYAEKIRKMFGKSYKTKKCGFKLSKNKLYKKLKNVRPGTHLRLAARKNGRGTAHSVVLLKITKDKIWYTDGNVDYHNGIRYAVESLDEFCWHFRGNGRRYLVWARVPKGKVPSVKGVSVRTNASYDGPETHVAWRPVKKAKKYIVYRSDQSGSGYVPIAETKGCYFIDGSEDLFGDAYYKVQAVKKGGKSATSKPAKAGRKVKSPVVYAKGGDDPKAPVFDLSWNAVPGASEYRIYKWDGYNERPVLTAVVNGTSWQYVGTPGEGYTDLFITAAAARGGSESFPAQLGVY